MNEMKPERFLDSLRNEREKYESESRIWRIIFFISCFCFMISIISAGVFAILNIGIEQDGPELASLLALSGLTLLGIGISYHKCQTIKKRTSIIDKIRDDLSKMNPKLIQIRNELKIQNELRYEANKLSKSNSNHMLNNFPQKRGASIHQGNNKKRPG